MGSESRQGLRIHRLVSHRVIDEHPRSRRGSAGERWFAQTGLQSRSRIRSGAVARRKRGGQARSSGLRQATACDRSPTSCRETKTAPQKRNVPLLQDRYFGCASKLPRHTGQTPARERWPHRDLHNRHKSRLWSSSRSGISGRAHRHRPLKPRHCALLYKRARAEGVRAGLQLPVQRSVCAPSRQWKAMCRRSVSTVSAVCSCP